MKTLIQIDNLEKVYGDRTLFDGASLNVAEKQKIAVIGRNGAGKSTLCRMITGEEPIEVGTITKTSALRLGYLQQADPYELDETVLEFLIRFTGFQDWECSLVAGRFQLKNDLLHATLGNLPGGFRTRAKLAAMLIPDPNFIILDEPTNYLDLSTLILLENFLRDFKGGFMLVSHDRHFLNKTCLQTLDIDQGRFNFYQGAIDDYFIYRDQVRESAEKQNEKVARKKKHLEQFVTRFRAKASKASAAKSKMKQIAKLESVAIDRPSPRVQIRLPRVEKKKGMALWCKKLDIGYPDCTVAKGIEFEIPRGQHIAVLGDNGQGKTTLLRTIAGELAAVSGKHQWSPDLKVGYYAQHVFAALPGNQTIEDYLIEESAEGVTRQEVLNLAGSFLFSGEDVKKKLPVLSGGERARVCLAGLLLARCTALLLDEPTNHLDFETVEALAPALREYQGTIIFVSHDRMFVNEVASRILDIRDGKVVPYPGTYEDYVYHLQQDALGENASVRLSGKGTDKKKGGSSQKDIDKRAKEIENLDVESKKLEQQVAGYREEKKGIEKGYPGFPQKWSKAGEMRLEKLKEFISNTETERKAMRTQLKDLKNQNREATKELEEQ